MFRIVEWCSVGNGNRSQFVGWLLGVPNVWVGERMFVVFCYQLVTQKDLTSVARYGRMVSSSRETDEVGLESVAKVTQERLDKVSNTC